MENDSIIVHLEIWKRKF